MSFFLFEKQTSIHCARLSKIIKSSCITNHVPLSIKFNESKFLLIRIRSESELLLVTRQNDNHSPGPGPGRLVPSSHQRSELSSTILSTFSRGDKRVWKCIPVPNGLGGKATLMNISVSNGNLICHRMIIPAALNQGDKVICWYTGLPFRLLYNNMSLLSLLRFLRDSHFKCSRIWCTVRVKSLV